MRASCQLPVVLRPDKIAPGHNTCTVHSIIIVEDFHGLELGQQWPGIITRDRAAGHVLFRSSNSHSESDVFGFPGSCRLLAFFRWTHPGVGHYCARTFLANLDGVETEHGVLEIQNIICFPCRCRDPCLVQTTSLGHGNSVVLASAWVLM
jgi:hypothetical protein